MAGSIQNICRIRRWTTKISRNVPRRPEVWIDCSVYEASDLRKLLAFWGPRSEQTPSFSQGNTLGSSLLFVFRCVWSNDGVNTSVPTQKFL
jgi:hypothetical protein